MAESRTNRRARIDLNQLVGVKKLPKPAAGIRAVDLNDDAIAALIPYQYRHTFARRILTAGHNPWYVAAVMSDNERQSEDGGAGGN